MAIRKQTQQKAGELEKSVSEYSSICIGGARLINQDGKFVAFFFYGTDRYLVMQEFKSGDKDGERIVYWFQVYKGTQSLNGCETYNPGTKIKPNKPYKLPDSLNEIIFEE